MLNHSMAATVAAITNRSEGLLRSKPYPVTEASEVLGLHAETLRRAIKRGQIKACRLGHWLIPSSEINRLRGGGLQ